MTSKLANTKAEIEQWFFDTYFNHWVAVGNGERDEGPEFVLQYWGVPMYATVDEPEMAMWMLTGEQVVEFLVLQHTLLREAGYSHTAVPDKRVFVYNSNGGSIDVIWSRRASDDAEIQRFVAHFEVMRTNDVWKVVGVQTRRTDASKDNDSIDTAWAI